jgi:hypothetical protein
MCGYEGANVKYNWRKSLNENKLNFYSSQNSVSVKQPSNMKWLEGRGNVRKV